MGMSEAGGRYQQGACLRHDAALLIEDFGLAVAETIVEIDRPQQDPMQIVIAVRLRPDLAVPVRTTALRAEIQLSIMSAEPSVDPLSTTTVRAGGGSRVASDCRHEILSAALFQLRMTTPNDRPGEVPAVVPP